MTHEQLVAVIKQSVATGGEPVVEVDYSVVRDVVDRLLRAGESLGYECWAELDPWPALVPYRAQGVTLHTPWGERDWRVTVTTPPVDPFAYDPSAAADMKTE